MANSFFSITLLDTTKNTISLKDFERDLTALEREVFPKALNRTANRVGVKAKNEAVRALVKDMGIKQKHIRPDDITIDKSTLREQNFSYTLRGSGWPLPLSNFKGAPLAHKSKLGKKGYAATTFGKRRQYKFFQAKMKSGHVGAFYREKGSTRGKSKKSGKFGVYPIKEAYGPSVYEGMKRDVVGRAFFDEATQGKVIKELSHNIEFYMGRIKKGGR